MATSKRAPGKTQKKGQSGKGKKRPRKAVSPLSRALEALGEAVSREAAGITLLALGLFFSAAFLSGRGAFLGEAGYAAATHLMGTVGLLLAPLAAVCGLLLVLGRLAARFVVGAFLLLLAAATTLAARLPDGRPFSAALYQEAGGIVGSGLYGAVSFAGGAIGAALALILLYALGLSLLTGVSFGSAFVALKTAAQWSVRRAGELWGRLREGRGGAPAEQRAKRGSRANEAPEVRDLHEEPPVPDPGPEPG